MNLLSMVANIAKFSYSELCPMLGKHGEAEPLYANFANISLSLSAYNVSPRRKVCFCPPLLRGLN